MKHYFKYEALSCSWVCIAVECDEWIAGRASLWIVDKLIRCFLYLNRGLQIHQNALQGGKNLYIGDDFEMIEEAGGVSRCS